MALGLITNLIGLPFQIVGGALGGIGGPFGGGQPAPPPPPPPGPDMTMVFLAVAGLGAVLLLKK